MKGPGGVALCVAAVWLCGILQVALAPRMAIGFGAPDFGLIVLGTVGLFCDRKGVTILGFGVGWIVGALAGQNLTLYVLSRSVAGFALGSAYGLGIQRNFLVSGLATVIVTLISELLMLFAGAHHGPLIAYLAGTLITTMYNGVIAAAIFGICNRLAGSRRQDRF